MIEASLTDNDHVTNTKTQRGQNSVKKHESPTQEPQFKSSLRSVG